MHPWGGHVGEQRLGVILYQNWAVTDRSIHSRVWLLAGISERLDYAIAQAVVIERWQVATPISEFLVRYFPLPGLGIVARATVIAGQSIALGPELHFQRKWGPFQFTANAAFRPPLAPDGAFPLLGIIGPEVYFHPRFSTYVEADAVYDFRSKTGNVVVTPGFGVVTHESRLHLMSVGLQIGVYPEISYLMGAWYQIIFEGL